LLKVLGQYSSKFICPLLFAKTTIKAVAAYVLTSTLRPVLLPLPSINSVFWFHVRTTEGRGAFLPVMSSTNEIGSDMGDIPADRDLFFWIERQFVASTVPIAPMSRSESVAAACKSALMGPIATAH